MNLYVQNNSPAPKSYLVSLYCHITALFAVYITFAELLKFIKANVHLYTQHYSTNMKILCASAIVRSNYEVINEVSCNSLMAAGNSNTTDFVNELFSVIMYNTLNGSFHYAQERIIICPLILYFNN